MRRVAKTAANVTAMVFVWPAAISCGRLRPASSHHSEAVFSFWAQVFSCVPGPPGIVIRRAFYRQTLAECARNFYMAFGSQFTHRDVSVEEDAYVGLYALVGCAALGRGCLVGSRVSILSGGALHDFQADGTWSAADYTQLRRVTIGAGAWIGEGAIVMADVGESSMVAAGAVVSTAVAPGIVVAGNPARFVRRLSRSASGDASPQEAATVEL